MDFWTSGPAAAGSARAQREPGRACLGACSDPVGSGGAGSGRGGRAVKPRL